MTDNVTNQYLHQPTIKVSDFEGPLDLLLTLIKSAEMDIYDIPVAQITAQYLSYLHQMQENQLEVAGDYFVMAATLMSIKSRMLLPVDEDELIDDQVPDPEDPRQELVDQLLEYKRYKQAAEQLHEKEQARQQEFTRQAAAIPDDVTAVKVAPGITTDKLQRAFMNLMKKKRIAQPLSQTVQTQRISLAQRMRQVLDAVKQAPVRFDELFEAQVRRDEMVTTFLAVLELCKYRAVAVDQSVLFSPLLLTCGPQSEEFEHEQFGTD